MHSTISACLLVIVAMLILIRLVQFALDKAFNYKSPISIFFMSMFVGIQFGLFLDVFNMKKFTTTLNEVYKSIFMTVLLPVIFFNSAVSLNKNYFFKNFKAILLYAFLPTGISIVILTLYCYFSSKVHLGFSLPLISSMMFSVLLGGMDIPGGAGGHGYHIPNRNLASLIYGEALLNDAVIFGSFLGVTNTHSEQVSKVLLSFLKEFVVSMTGSLLIGFAFGFLACFILKYIHRLTVDSEITYNYLANQVKNSKAHHDSNYLSALQRDSLSSSMGASQLSDTFSRHNSRDFQMMNRMKYGLPPEPRTSEVIHRVPIEGQRVGYANHFGQDQRVDQGVQNVHGQVENHEVEHHGGGHGHGHHAAVFDSNLKNMKGETLEFHQIQLGVFESQLPFSPDAEEFARAKRTFSNHRNQELAVAFIIPLLSYLFAEVRLSELAHVWNHRYPDLRAGPFALRAEEPEPQLPKDLQADPRDFQRAV